MLKTSHCISCRPVLYILGIILTNYWQIAKLGALQYYGNDTTLAAGTCDNEVMHQTDNNSSHLHYNGYTHCYQVWMHLMFSSTIIELMSHIQGHLHYCKDFKD